MHLRTIDKHAQAKEPKLKLSSRNITDSWKCSQCRVKMWHDGRGDRIIAEAIFEGEWKRWAERETILAEMLWCLKVFDRNVTLLYTTLNCAQTICVMTCLAERGIHWKKRVELVQEKYPKYRKCHWQTAWRGQNIFLRTEWSQNRDYDVPIRFRKEKNLLEKSVLSGFAFEKWTVEYKCS